MFEYSLQTFQQPAFFIGRTKNTEQVLITVLENLLMNTDMLCVGLMMTLILSFVRQNNSSSLPISCIFSNANNVNILPFHHNRRVRRESTQC